MRAPLAIGLHERKSWTSRRA